MAQTLTKYAQTVINQADMQHPDRNNWANPENAQGHITTTSTSAEFTLVNKKIKVPHILYAYDFDCDLPSDAVVTSFKFQIRMKCTGDMKVKKPWAIFNSYEKGIFKNSNIGGDASNHNTGDYNGIYRYFPEANLTNSWATYTYEMPTDNLSKFKDLNYTINNQGFGLQLGWRASDKVGFVRVMWVRVIIEYEIPHPYVTIKKVSANPSKPTTVNFNKEFTIELEAGNSSIAKTSTLPFQIALPIGFELVSEPVCKGDSIRYSDGEWRVKGKAKSKATMVMKVVARASGAKTLKVFPVNGIPYNGYYFVKSSDIVDFDDIQVVFGDMRRGEKSCMTFHALLNTNDTTWSLNVDFNQSLSDNDVVSCILDENASNDGVSLTGYSVNNTQVNFNFALDQNARNTDIIIEFTFCYYPTHETIDNLMTWESSNNITGSTTYTVLEHYIKKLMFNLDENGECTHVINIECNRIASQVEGDLVVLPISTDVYDADMYVDNTTFKLNQWKKKRYFGCVELPYAHYKPKHTSKDKLLDEHYKNFHYLGKENAVDEDITLKIKVPRRKVPTLIGLLDIDRPQPVNLVPTAFENDPLNHRGWVEYTGITVDPTNPLYDDCELDVKYITHNIISRFEILVDSTTKFSLPQVYTNSLDSGGDMGDYFNIETDGSFIYDEEDNSTHRNMFTFNNQQTINLRSKTILSPKTQFDFYWDMVLFDELRENNISKVIRLVDESNRVVFEYEYYDFDFSDDVYSCSVIGRVLTDYGYNSVINKDIYVHSDVEYTGDEDSDDYDEYGLDYYGSQCSFLLDGSNLTVTEKGFSGFEFSQPVNLLKGSYYLEVYWKNNNNDADTRNAVCYFDFDINELHYDSVLASKYSSLIVSPYPVPNKEIVFTRNSEEGTIYYLKDDGEEFTFLLEPFYQYYCGVDLVAEGASIFNFNNSYPVIYVQNGLIRFGINRINGDLYLDKYDTQSKDYVRTNRFRIDKYDDAEVSIINDDMIVLNVSDMHITMWRGRPYVMIQHETEDITILDSFSKVFADGVNDKISDYPIIFNLMNSKNLLPECVGGTQLLKSSCITVTEDDTVLEDIGDFILYPDKTECYVGEDVVCTLRGDFDDDTVVLLVNGEPVGYNTGNTITTNLTMEGLNEIYAVYLGDDTTNYELSNKLAIKVSKGGGAYKLECLTTGNLLYNQGTVDFRLTYNDEPVEGIEIEVYNPNQTWHLNTNANGIVKSSNLSVDAGTHSWVATAYDEGELLTFPCNVKFKVVKSTPQLKAGTISLKKGNHAIFRLLDESNNPIEGAVIDLNVGGTKYTRTTQENGRIYVKLNKEGNYNTKVKYAGENKHYKPVSGTWNVVVE